MLPTILLSMLQAAASVTAPAPAVGAAVQPPTALTSAKCPNATVRQAGIPERVAPQRLDQLPPGRLELTVLREFDRCPIPAVLREGIGGNPAAGEPERR